MIIPQETKEQILNYVNHRVPPGSFLRAVLENKLKESFMFADEKNTICMHGIVSFLYNEVPTICYGSPEKVDAWLAGEE